MSLVLNFVDRFQTTLASGYTAGGGSLSLTSASGLPSGACYFYLIVRAETTNTEEVFLVSNVSGTTLTVAGAQAGTSASNHASGAVVVASIETADVFTSMLAIASGGLLNTFTDPTTPSWAWSNQGSSTITTSNSSLILYVPAQASDNLRIREVAVPTAPYTVTMAFIPLFQAANFVACGMCLRDSASGKAVTLGVGWDSGVTAGNVVQNTKWTNATTFSAHYVNITMIRFGPVAWLRIVDDNVNRKTYYSMDGVSWLLLYSVARTDFMTPNKIGFYANMTNSADAYIRVLSWLQA